MPRTKKKPETTLHPISPAPLVNGPADEVLTLSEAATYLRLPEREVISAVHSQGLAGRLIGGEWRFLKSAIQKWLSTGSLSPRTSKEALLAAAGSFREDPDLDGIVEEAMRLRGRPAPEGE